MSRVHEALSKVISTNSEPGAVPSESEPSGVPLFTMEQGEPSDSWASEATMEQTTPPREDGAVPAREFIEFDQIEDPGAGEGERTLPPVSDAPVRRVAEKLILSPDVDGESVEQFRRLAGRLHLAQAEHGIKVVMIASALPGEGKTLTATNLALTLSESYHRNVLVIDGDLRRPSLHEMFHIQNLSGLNDGLRSDTLRKVPLVRWSDHLSLLTAGRPDSDPMKVLVSLKMRNVIDQAAARFEWVIIDTPPVGLMTDASLFSSMVDAVVLVVQAGRTPYADIQRAVQALGRDRVFGVVLNRAAARQAAGGYYGYEYRYSQPVPSNDNA